MVMFKIAAAVGIIFFWQETLLSQERREPSRLSAGVSDSLLSRNFSSVVVDKNLDTYLWSGLVSYKKMFGRDSISLDELFQSTVIRSDRKRITDVQSLELFTTHRLADPLHIAGKVSSFSVSDNQSLGISNVSSNAVYGGIEYRADHSFSITPLIGLRQENQIGQQDNGLSYLMTLASDSLLYEGYRTGLSGKYEYDKLSPRVLETRNFSMSAEKYFFEQTRNMFQFIYTRNRRDFYSPADAVIQQQFNVGQNIDTRSEDAFLVADTLDYTVSGSTQLKILGTIFTRSIDRETRYKYYANNPNPTPNTMTDELKIDGGAELMFGIGTGLTSLLRFSYQERDEKHQLRPEDSLSTLNIARYTTLEEGKNNHARQTSLASATAVTFSSSHMISFSGSTSLLRFDTPSIMNDDDRDELRYTLNMTSSHIVNQHLRVRIAADVNLTHLVYIGSTRSADNTWNRIFRLSPRIEYSPAKTVITVNTFEVLANYTAYDFEYPASPIRSFAFRQFGFNDSTGIELTRRLGVDFYTQIRFYERGELQWDAFTERPLNYFEDKTYIIALHYSFNSRLLFSLGIRYFSQSRFGYLGSERQLESFLRSSGPISNINWNVGQRMAFSMKGWYEDQTQTGIASRSFANMTMTLFLHI